MADLEALRDKVVNREITLMAALLEVASQSIKLADLAIWCPYHNDLVNPTRTDDFGEPGPVLMCPVCERSIGHTEFALSAPQ